VREYAGVYDRRLNSPVRSRRCDDGEMMVLRADAL
jgi:hypothetical protein